MAYTFGMLVTGGGDRVATKLQSSVMDELGRKSVSLLNKSMTTSN